MATSYPVVRNRMAWVRIVGGERNIWVADGPGATPRQVTDQNRLLDHGDRHADREVPYLPPFDRDVHLVLARRITGRNVALSKGLRP